MSIKATCKYKSPDGESCRESDMGSGFCFWHDPTIDKSDLRLASKLEKYANKGGLLKGLELKRADLRGLNLIKVNNRFGYDLSFSNFYRANLKGAHLYNSVICHASLMKADLCEANLHCCKLHNTNLLGTNLSFAKIDNFEVGEQLLQEKQAFKALKNNQKQEAMDLFLQSEEVYRLLRKSAEKQGLLDMSGKFSYCELCMKHQRYPKFSLQKVVSSCINFLCGYGEKPENVIRFSLNLILICSLFYFFLGLFYQGEEIRFDTQNTVNENISAILDSIYFSVVTFTTLGYGDITPVGFSKLVATIEAFIGSFSMALFVVVFVKRMVR